MFFQRISSGSLVEIERNLVAPYAVLYGVWRMAYGVWRMAYGVWRMAYAAAFAVAFEAASA